MIVFLPQLLHPGRQDVHQDNCWIHLHQSIVDIKVEARSQAILLDVEC